MKRLFLGFVALMLMVVLVLTGATSSLAQSECFGIISASLVDESTMLLRVHESTPLVEDQVVPGYRLLDLQTGTSEAITRLGVDNPMGGLISPDGQMMAFVPYDGTDTAIRIYRFGVGVVEDLLPAEHEDVVVPDVRSYRWLPDSSGLVVLESDYDHYDHPENTGNIIYVQRFGQEPEFLTELIPHLNVTLGPVNPNDLLIYAVQDRGGHMQIWTYDLDTGEDVEVGGVVGLVDRFGWNVDGTQVLMTGYTSEYFGTNRLLDLPSGEITTVYQSESWIVGVEFSPWEADVFASFYPNEADEIDRLMVNRDGEETFYLLDLPGLSMDELRSWSWQDVDHMLVTYYDRINRLDLNTGEEETVYAIPCFQ